MDSVQNYDSYITIPRHKPTYLAYACIMHRYMKLVRKSTGALPTKSGLAVSRIHKKCSHAENCVFAPCPRVQNPSERSR
jgi:hypothetical protein